MIGDLETASLSVIRTDRTRRDPLQQALDVGLLGSSKACRNPHLEIRALGFYSALCLYLYSALSPRNLHVEVWGPRFGRYMPGADHG